MILKINLENALDRLEWSNIRDSLNYYFSPIMVKLIMSRVSTSSIDILGNGTRTMSFKPSKGIRQEDSISSYLFILYIEWIFRDIDTKTYSKVWNPIRIFSLGPKIFHFLFSNDLTLLSKSKPEYRQVINSTLTDFYLKFGQNLNRSKSKLIFFSNFNVETISFYSNLLNISVSKTFGKYLGFSIFHAK